MEFEEGLTAIVGPNGCGKSNVVDALRWVMGEQNARHLRGGQMADVIFGGSEKKGILGFCEVTLTIENDKQDAPLEFNHFNEIEITRRLYRTGEAEYEINRTKVRLKDINDFFLGTGVGTKAYSIIEQGRIHEIILAKPQEKRLIIEEAAGITKYKSKRALAEKRMELTRQNLERIIDIKNEVNRRVDSLSKEKEKLDKLLSLKNELKNIDMHSASHEFLALYAILRFVSKNKEIIEKDLLENKKFLAFEQHIFDKILEKYINSSENKRILEDIFVQHKSTLALLKKDHDFARESLDNNKILVQQLMESDNSLEARKFDIEKTLKDHDKNLIEIIKKIDDLKKIIEEIKLENQSTINKRQEHLIKEKELSQKLLEQASLAARLQGEINAIDREELQRQKDLKNFEQEKELKNNELNLHSQRILIIKNEYSQASDRHEELKIKIKTQEDIINEIEKQKNQIKDELNSLNKENLVYVSRLDSLLEIEKNLDWSISGIHNFLSSHEKEQIISLVADSFEVIPGWESLVELCLSSLLDLGIVLNTKNLLKLYFLKQSEKFRTTDFLLLDHIPKNINLLDRLENLSTKIIIKNEKLSNLNNWFSRFFIAKDIEEALFYWPDAQVNGFIIVTINKEIFHADGRVTFLGQDKEAQVLNRKKEIAKLNIKVKDLQKIINEKEEILYQLDIKNRVLYTNKDNLIKEAKNLWQAIIRLEENIKQKNKEEERLILEAKKNQIKSVELNELNLNKDERLNNIKLKWSNALDEHKKFEDELNILKQKKEEVEKEYYQYHDKLKTYEVEKAYFLEKNNSINNSIVDNKNNLKHVEEQQQKIKEQLIKKNDEEILLNEKIRQAQGKISVLLNEIENCESKLENAKNETLSLEKEKKDLELKLKVYHDNELKLKDLLHKEELKFNDTKNNINILCEKIFERYKERLEDFLSDFHSLPLDEKLAKKQIVELRSGIEKMGLVNENAHKDYETFKNRQDFLENQVMDLNDALIQLEEAIKKINQTTQMRFFEAFNEINKQFSLVFPRLFNGGKAYLKLLDPENLLTSGIDIVASPPGKNIQSIDLMSGGEKALTAISLIVAIFLIKPSPFCLLDEVDAPLDEANVARFSQLIKEMSILSQFIVITHNRKTMESANQIFGVTMEEPGESKIVSVKIDEAFLHLKNIKHEKSSKQMSFS